MSRRRSFDSIQFAAASQGRAAVAAPVLTWTKEPTWRSAAGGAWVCRTAEGQFLAAVFVCAGKLLAVAAPDTASQDSFDVPGTWAVNPIGLRAAKLAVEVFIAGHGAEQSQAEVA